MKIAFTIKLSSIKERKVMCRPGMKMKSKKDYVKNIKHKKNISDLE